MLTIFIVKNGLTNAAKVFIALKSMFPEGNTKLTAQHRYYIMSICGIKDSRTLKKCLEYLIRLNWIWYCHRTKNYNLRSFFVICSMNDLKYNYGHSIDVFKLSKFNALLGVIIFNFCRISFWRTQIRLLKEGKKEITVNRVVYFLLPQKGKGCVRRKGGTNKAFSFSALIKEPAPISLNGVSRFLGIDKTKVHRLKQIAENENYLKVQHSYEEIPIPVTSASNYNRFSEDNRFVKVKNGKIIAVNIDVVSPTNIHRKRLHKNKNRNHNRRDIKRNQF